MLCMSLKRNKWRASSTSIKSICSLTPAKTNEIQRKINEEMVQERRKLYEEHERKNEEKKKTNWRRSKIIWKNPRTTAARTISILERPLKLKKANKKRIHLKNWFVRN